MLDNNYLKRAITLLEDIAAKDRISKQLESNLNESIQKLHEQSKELVYYDVQLTLDTEHIRYTGRSKSSLNLVKGEIYPIVDENETEYMILVENGSMIPLSKEVAVLINKPYLIGINAVRYLVENPLVRLYNQKGESIEYTNSDDLILKTSPNTGLTVSTKINKELVTTMWYLEPVREYAGENGFRKLLKIFHSKKK